MSEPHDDLREEELQEAPLRQNKADRQSPGEIIREGRLAHDYSVADLCAQTKLSTKTVQALEDNDFNALSQPVFARGYYRQCAKVLDLNVERVMVAYTAWAGEPAAQPAAPATAVHVVPYDVTPGGFRLRGLLLLVTVIVLAGVAAIVLLPSMSSNSMGTDDNDSGTSTTQILSDDDQAGGNNNTTVDTSNRTYADNGNGGTPDVVGGGEPQANTGKTPGGRNVNQTLGITPPGQNSAANGAGNATSGEPAVAPNHLQLVFNKRSWVRVTDASGKQMASGIFEAGDTQEFDGTPPYSVKLGFAPGVAVSIGGQSVDVAGQTDSGSVARLTVNAPSGNDDNNGG